MIYSAPPMSDRDFERFFGYAPRKFVPRKKRVSTSNKLADVKTKDLAELLLIP